MRLIGIKYEMYSVHPFLDKHNVCHVDPLEVLCPDVGETVKDGDEVCLNCPPIGVEKGTREAVQSRGFVHGHVMARKCRGSIVVLSISKSVEPNKKQKEMTSSFQ